MAGNVSYTHGIGRGLSPIALEKCSRVMKDVELKTRREGEQVEINADPEMGTNPKLQ